MIKSHHFYDIEMIFQLVMALLFIFAILLYLFAVIFSNQRNRKWPLYRSVLWIFGIICASASYFGPLTHQFHHNFTSHMLVHILLGMLSPLLLVLAAPMTLLLRSIPVNQGRRLTRLLKSWPARISTDPVIASILNIGGLWILYTTDLYMLMQHNLLLHLLVHIHLFFAGCLFTVSMINMDRFVHPVSFVYRAIILVISLAGHDILAKYIYAYPPNHVPQNQAEFGGLLMHYGGDAIDLVLIFTLCYQWFKATRPRKSFSMDK